MPEIKKSIRIVTSDEALLASVRAAVSGLKGWTLEEPLSIEALLKASVPSGDVILLDAWQRSENVYESCRRLAGKTKCRTYVVTDPDNALAEPIALFCGATGTLRDESRVRSVMRKALKAAATRRGSGCRWATRRR